MDKIKEAGIIILCLIIIIIVIVHDILTWLVRKWVRSWGLLIFTDYYTNTLLMDKDFAISVKETNLFHSTHIKAITNRLKTIEFINRNGGIYGDVLDIGENNLLTIALQHEYNIHIDNTEGDLDIELKCHKKQYDFIIYSHVIEHQFNPLFTLLEIKKVMKAEAKLLIATPIHPNWITPSDCHFHEMDLYRFTKLVNRAGFKIIDSIHYWRDVQFTGIRPLLGSFFYKTAIFWLE